MPKTHCTLQYYYYSAQCKKFLEKKPLKKVTSNHPELVYKSSQESLCQFNDGFIDFVPSIQAPDEVQVFVIVDEGVVEDGAVDLWHETLHVRVIGQPVVAT